MKFANGNEMDKATLTRLNIARAQRERANEEALEFHALAIEHGERVKELEKALADKATELAAAREEIATLKRQAAA